MNIELKATKLAIESFEFVYRCSFPYKVYAIYAGEVLLWSKIPATKWYVYKV